MDAEPPVASPLHDTPAWSFSRRLTTQGAIAFGGAMVLLGAFGTYWRMTDMVATTLINSGATTLWGCLLIYVGGASAERAAGWFSFFKREH